MSNTFKGKPEVIASLSRIRFVILVLMKMLEGKKTFRHAYLLGVKTKLRVVSGGMGNLPQKV